MDGPATKETANVGLLITLVAMAASVAMALTFPGTLDAVREDPRGPLAFLALTLFLQLFALEVYGRGSISVGAIGVLAAGFALGPGPAMMIAALAALLQWIRRRGLLHRAIFDAANFSLSAATAALLYQLVAGHDGPTALRASAAVLAGAAYCLVNTGLLCLAMSIAESTTSRAVWNERFRWLTGHYLAFGPLAFASTIAYERIGVAGLLAFALPPALMIFSVRQYLERTREAVEEVRAANHDLRTANAELAGRNDDLRELFQFAGGLAARAHDRDALAAYASAALRRLTGARAEVIVGEDETGLGLPLWAGDKQVGAVRLEDRARFDSERWERLQDAILPQLATALESCHLVEEVRRTHLATIAALSRSMEVKDYYTGGHTERVAATTVALAKRLGYSGPDLDAVEIGAVLHDIGKIGIPERILHKPGPLDDEEWRVMKEHPIISEYILADVDLPDVVRQIARSSHERVDGKGYPDGLRSENIPLPARIVLVADALDALTSDRPYRPARTLAAAIEEIRAHSGTQFCPRVAEALERMHREEPQLLGVPRLRAVQAGAA